MNLMFRVEATPALGTGHLMRCLVLAEKLRELKPDAKTTFILSNNSASTEIEKYGFSVNILPSAKNMVKEIKQYGKFLEEALFITDIPDIPEDYLNALKKKVRLLVSIDDGSGTLFNSNILINPNLSPDIDPKYSSQTRYYKGAKYVILKKAFSNYGADERQIKREAESLVLCFGGSDKNNLTKTVVNALRNLNFRILVIVGAMYPYFDELLHSVKLHANVKIEKNVSNMPELLHDVDLAIISGGTMLYEACVVGTPVIIICQNHKQNIESEFFAKKNAAINLGVFDGVSEETVRNAVVELSLDYTRRKLLSKNAGQLIDGKGADRIAGILLKEYSEKS